MKINKLSMLKILNTALALFCFTSTYSQDYISEIKKMTLENDSLQKQVIKPLRDSISNLNRANVSENLKFQIRLNALKKDSVDISNKIKGFEKDIASLNKNNVKIQNDSLQKQLDRINANVASLNQKNLEKDAQIVQEKLNVVQTAKAEKDKGRNEVLEQLARSYLNKIFDDLIQNTTKLAVQRDIELIGSNLEVKTIVSDLEKYFNAEELLTKKIDFIQIKSALIQLNQIKQQSTLLIKLKENVEFYKDYNEALKKVIEKLVDLDKNKRAARNPEIQKEKFNDIISQLSNFMYDYYDYVKYPYLSEIILEIIKRKKPNPDADITDLLKKL